MGIGLFSPLLSTQCFDLKQVPRQTAASRGTVTLGLEWAHRAWEEGVEGCYRGVKICPCVPCCTCLRGSLSDFTDGLHLFGD